MSEIMDPKKPTISLIISAYNEEDYIASCLSSVEQNASNQLFEVIVVDNNSTDKTAEIAKSFSNVRVILEKEKGVTKARERGFRESTGDIVAFMDADCRMPEGWARRVAEEFDGDPSLACLSGPYVFYDASKWQNFLSWCYWYLLGIPSYFLTGYMAVAGNMVLRRSVLEKMGGFDTSIVFYGDDTDTARRAKKFGKVSFKTDFIMPSSSRRLKKQGVVKTLFAYVSNFLSQVFFHKSADKKEYKSFR